LVNLTSSMSPTRGAADDRVNAGNCVTGGNLYPDGHAVMNCAAVRSDTVAQQTK
jgi:hypothetical protein